MSMLFHHDVTKPAIATDRTTAAFLRFDLTDAAATGALVRTYAPKVLSVAKQILSNEDESRQATVETFRVLFWSLRKSTSTMNVDQLVHEIAVGVCLARVMSTARQVCAQPTVVKQPRPMVVVFRKSMGSCNFPMRRLA